MRLSLADVLPSAAAAIGVPKFENRLDLPPVRHAVVCLIDGLGWHLMRRYPQAVPFLAHALDAAPIACAFPSTTPVGLASLGTGLQPGSHGFVGASFLLPETGHVLSPLHWGGDPTPMAVQPESTVFERVAAAGFAVSTVAPGAYRSSGLTRAALRGASYRSCEGIQDRVEAVQRAVMSEKPSLTYVYWADVDRAGHEFGVNSAQWQSAVKLADELVMRIFESLPPGALMVVTSDHGMVDCPDSHRISIDITPGLRQGVTHVAGEPRLRHVYAHNGAQSDVADTWKAVLSDRMSILTREELIDTGALGPVDAALDDRIGDVVAVAEGEWMLTSHTDVRVSNLRGQHGSWTIDEMEIPAIVLMGA